jgi:RNA polymerase sporulation-specific sigma factor
MEEQVLEQVSLREAVEGLPERERMVVILRYYRGLTQEKVSKIIGVSQVQVSRIEKKAMNQLRRQLEE